MDARMTRANRRADLVVSEDVWKLKMAFPAGRVPTLAMGLIEAPLLVSLLQLEDRTAAAFGLENQSPFLDHRIVEFAFCIPSDMKMRDCTLKWILRQVAARYLPRAVLERGDKMGLIFPVNVWFQWSGKRGEFDRRSYDEHCMRVWREVLFSGEGAFGRG